MTNFTVFLVLITIVCFLLIVVIMVQNPKGGGLSSSFGATNLGGIQKTTDFLDKSTWTLSALLIALILLSGVSFTGATGDNKLKTIDPTEAAAPATPTPAAPKQATPVAPETK